MTKTITAMFGIAVFAAILFGSAVLAPQAFAGVDPDPNEADKVVICHNGDYGPETIEVSGNAVDKHLDKHGDSLGECPAPDCALCFGNAISEFFACEAEGGSTAECEAQVSPSFSECALMCEESNSGDKEQACVSAGTLQYSVCIEEGVLTDSECAGNAIAFHAECTGPI